MAVPELNIIATQVTGVLTVDGVTITGALYLGGGTGTGSDKTYLHTQSIAADVWNIAHNLSKKPSVTVIDSSGSVLLGEITYNDNNSLTINFGGVEVTGIATLN